MSWFSLHQIYSAGFHDAPSGAGAPGAAGGGQRTSAQTEALRSDGSAQSGADAR
jgi:hypothetical protein